MATYEYNEEDLPEVHIEESRTLPDGSKSSVICSGDWTMEYINPALPDDKDSLLEDVEETILAWIAYRNWLEKNPPERVKRVENDG